MNEIERRRIERLFQRYTEAPVDKNEPTQTERDQLANELTFLMSLRSGDDAEAGQWEERIAVFQCAAEKAGFFAGFKAATDLLK